MYTAPPICGFAVILSFSIDPKLLEDQAVTLISPRAGAVSGLGMESDEYKANDPVLDVPKVSSPSRPLWLERVLGVPVPTALG